jgi:hypothetical protein
MQNAKDTFYEVLRGRLAAVNPTRVVQLRGVVRPGVVVVENELESAAVLPDCFRISWSEAVVEVAGALPMVTLTCAIEYETAGSGVNGGMDRGRALAAMDAELLAAVTERPWSAPKMSYAALATGGVATAMQTSVWWAPPVMGKTVVERDRVGRTATVAVMSYQEAGEL